MTHWLQDTFCFQKCQKVKKKHCLQENEPNLSWPLGRCPSRASFNVVPEGHLPQSLSLIPTALWLGPCNRRTQMCPMFFWMDQMDIWIQFFSDYRNNTWLLYKILFHPRAFTLAVPSSQNIPIPDFIWCLSPIFQVSFKWSLYRATFPAVPAKIGLILPQSVSLTLRISFSSQHLSAFGINCVCFDFLLPTTLQATQKQGFFCLVGTQAIFVSNPKHRKALKKIIKTPVSPLLRESQLISFWVFPAGVCGHTVTFFLFFFKDATYLHRFVICFFSPSTYYIMNTFHIHMHGWPILFLKGTYYFLVRSDPTGFNQPLQVAFRLSQSCYDRQCCKGTSLYKYLCMIICLCPLKCYYWAKGYGLTTGLWIDSKNGAAFQLRNPTVHENFARFRGSWEKDRKLAHLRSLGNSCLVGEIYKIPRGHSTQGRTPPQRP